MIINPIVAAAATVAARAVGTILPGDWMARRSNYRSESSFRESFPTNHYFMEDDLHNQARELEDFVTNTPLTANKQPIQMHNSIDAEIISKEQTTQNEASRKPPPPLPNTNDPLILLGLNPGASFDAIRRAYKDKVKKYHPDVVVGPDASADERQAANWDFARINAAFDILKRKENEEVLEYTVYVDGERVTRSVVASEESRHRDPTYINYDRIREMAEYRKHRPKEKMWYEHDHDYQTRYNGFGVDESNYDSYSRGKWWTHMRTFEHDRDDAYSQSQGRYGFGHIPSNEKRWEERQMLRQEVAGDYNSSRGTFGVNPSKDRWWNENHESEFEAPPNNYAYQPRDSKRFHAEMNQGFPYKDRLWNEGPIFGEAGSDRPNYNNAFDYDPQEYFPMKEKWWQVDDPTIGDFAP